MNIAIYARVSTSDGRQNVDNQLVVLREWAARMGATRIVEYVDHASGSRADRVRLLALVEGARKREFDVVLIWSLDRLSREGISKLAGHLDRFKSYGVRVLSHTEPWLDTQGPVSDLLVAIFGWCGQMERVRLKERIVAGLNTARAKGKILGRPVKPRNTALILNLRSSGKSIRAIAALSGNSKTTVARVLTGA